MAIEVSERESDGWWLMRLSRKLDARMPRLTMLNDRFEGRPPDDFGIDGKAAEAYRAFKRKARTSYEELIVEAARERMTLTGFRTSQTAAGEEADDVTSRIMRANQLAVIQADVHTAMGSLGDGYTIVAGVEGQQMPVITAEDPRQVVTIHDPIDQSQIRAAAKIFHDEEAEEDLAYLWLPGRQRVARRPRRARNPGVRFSPSTWDWDDDRSGNLPIDDLMPVKRFRNRRGVAEFERHVDLIDRISHMILQRMVIATLQAFRQRAIKGLPDVDESGNEIDWEGVFTADPGALWQVPAAVEFWESGQAELTPILNSVKDDVRELAAVTRTPLASLQPEGGNQSAEGAAYARESLTFRTEDRIVRASAGWVDTMYDALRIYGDTERADRETLTPLWAPVDRLSMAERADAATKAREDLPLRWRLEKIWGLNPDEIAQVEADRAAELLAMQDLLGSAESGVEVAPGLTAVELNAKLDALGKGIRAGADSKSVSELLGLSSLKFTGAVPVSLRVPERDADKLED